MKTTLQISDRLGQNSFADTLSHRLWSLESVTLCAQARRRTGLEDFGTPAIEPALSLLTNSLEREAKLHPLGRFLMRIHLQGLLETRLRLAEIWSRNPGARDDSPVRRPIFITGMPRSGSTFLHELLAEDPAHRAPRVWEVMYPVSAADPNRQLRERQVWRAAACLWWFRRLAPRADAVYPMRARTPHECVAIHSYTLLSEEFVSSCRIPGYEAFLRSSDLRPAYLWQRRFLQHLQQGQPEKAWLLKSPDHVHGLDALFTVFPDALVIQTHRNPSEVIRSSVQLNEVLQGLFARPGDHNRLVEREVRVLAAAMGRFIRFRDAHPELADRFLDVNYRELVTDPLAVVRRVYQRFEMPLPETVARRMRELARHRGRYRAAPTLASVGPHILAQKMCFHNYCQRFGITY
jgi:hypothetical protein